MDVPTKIEKAMSIKWFMIWVSEYHSILFSTVLCGSHYIYVIVSGYSIYKP